MTDTRAAARHPAHSAEARTWLLPRPGALLDCTIAGRGPAVLLIQDIGAPSAVWRTLVEKLADRFEVIAFDRRAIEGDEPAGDPIDAIAADALAIMDARRIDHFHVVGHGTGALVAEAIAEIASDRVSSLSRLSESSSGRASAPVAIIRELAPFPAIPSDVAA